MKKTFILLLALFMLCLTGCQKTDGDDMEYQATEKTSEKANKAQESEVIDATDYDDEDVVMPDEELVMPEEETTD